MKGTKDRLKEKRTDDKKKRKPKQESDYGSESESRQSSVLGGKKKANATGRRNAVNY